MGDAHPNQAAIAQVGEEVQKLGQSVDKSWEEIYKAQQPLMTWPAAVSEVFAKRPFGADLSDQANRFLIQYQRAYPDQIDELFAEFDPIEVEENSNEVYGTIEVDKGVLRHATFTRIPLSMEAWQAQEDLWIQRAIIKAIRKANEGAEDWHSAAIRRLLAIGIGKTVDGKTQAGAPQLVDANGLPAGSGAEGGEGGPPAVGGGNQGVEAYRYLSKTAQYRVVPIYLLMLVDQAKIPGVLATLSEMDFHFTIQQVNVKVPDGGVTVPAILQQSDLFGQGGARDDSAFNSMEVEVWGQMRIYEMPESMKTPPPGTEGAPAEGTPAEGAPPATGEPADGPQ
jgi:hypothetical protein